MTQYSLNDYGSQITWREPVACKETPSFHIIYDSASFTLGLLVVLSAVGLWFYLNSLLVAQISLRVRE